MKLRLYLPPLAALFIAAVVIAVMGGSSEPEPAGATGAIPLASGGGHSCVLLDGGTVKCWGFSTNGQLGGDASGCNVLGCQTPIDVCADAGCSSNLSGITAISAGLFHTCGITSGGGLKCWGDNEFGQIGGATAETCLPGNDPCATRPTDVTGLSRGVTAVAAGHYYTCAVVSGGVKCWGDNENGQLGAASSDNCGSMFFPHPCSLTPLDVPGLSNVVDLAAGDLQTCALLSTGGVKCWGTNGAWGVLGDGLACGGFPPCGPVDVTGLSSGVADITAGSRHTCALLDTGGMKCWGRNVDGQLGSPQTGACGFDSDPCSTTPADVTGLSSGVVTIGSHTAHTCASLDTGGIKCWGRRRFGNLGNGDETSGKNAAPVDVVASQGGPPLTGFAFVAPGEEHTCAVTQAATVKCWGFNSTGALGNGTDDDSAVPVDVLGLPPAKTGGDFTPGPTNTPGGPTPTPGGKIVQQSTFDSNAEGWTMVNNGASTVPDHSGGGGNPGGYIEDADALGGPFFAFNAPAKYLGNQSDYYGKTLSFYLWTTAGPPSASVGANIVTLRGNGQVIEWDADHDPLSSWTAFEVPLQPDAAWDYASTDTPVSQADMKAILADLTALEIRGDYVSGDDTTSLDEVAIFGDKGPTPTPGDKTYVQSAFDTGTDNWTMINNGASTVPDHNPAGGNPGGYISDVDAASGPPFRFVAPATFLGNQSAMYGKGLTFSMRNSPSAGGAAPNLVTLRGGGISIEWDGANIPGAGWKTYTAALDEGGGWVLEGTNTAPSQGQMQTVLGNLTALEILGDLTFSTDTTDLDTVILGTKPGVTPAPPTPTSPGGATATPTSTPTPGGTVTPPPECTTTGTIPDDDPTGVTNCLLVNDGRIVTDVDVNLFIKHTYVGDLRITLEHAGVTVTLFDTSFCSGDNIDATLDDEAATPISGECAVAAPTINGTFRPVQPLSAFDGQPVAGYWKLKVTDTAAQDTGTLNSWGLDFDVTDPATATPTSTLSPTPTPTTGGSCVETPSNSIPDNDPTGITKCLTVSTPGSIVDVNVTLVINHTYVGDIKVTLTKVGTAKSITLIDRPGVDVNPPYGCGFNNISVTLDDNAAQSVQTQCSSSGNAIDGTFKPAQPLSTFNGQQAAGQWKLTITDNATGDVGNLVDYTQTFTVSGVPTATPSGVSGDANCNGQVNAIDVAIILQVNAGLLGSVPCFVLADVNQNGQVNAIDGAVILQFIAGLIPTLPV